MSPVVLQVAPSTSSRLALRRERRRAFRPKRQPLLFLEGADDLVEQRQGILGLRVHR